MNNNIIEFYLKAIGLKSVDRTGWLEVGISNPESVMDHIGGTILLAMSINEEKGLDLDMSKVYEMIAVKELKKVISNNEESVISGNTNSNTSEELLNILSNNSRLIDINNEVNEGTSREAIFANMVSKLESDMQAKKYELEGLFTVENAKKDIDNYPEDIKSRLTNISKASDGWLEYDKKYYDDMFLELSKELQEK